MTVEMPTDFLPESLADYIEVKMLFDDLPWLSQADLRNDFMSGQQRSAQELDFALGEIERRSTTCGRAYAYRKVQEGVERQVNEMTVIHDCLMILSLQGTQLRREAQYSRSDPIFDAIVEEAAVAYLGTGAQSVIFGWPARGGRPIPFVEAVSWLGSQMGVPDGVMDRPPAHKDAGVDIVVWKPFGDCRTGFPVFLIQNTIKADYAYKGHDINTSDWLSWLRFGTPPGRGLAIPYEVRRGDDRWAIMNGSVDLILDRERIIEKLSERGSFSRLSDLTRFVNEELEGARSGGPVRSPATRRQKPSQWRDRRAR